MVTAVPPAVGPLAGATLVTVGAGAVSSVQTEWKLAGSLWLLYSAVIQSAERATVERRTSSSLPLNHLPGTCVEDVHAPIATQSVLVPNEL
jgi:hypothetical protein